MLFFMIFIILVFVKGFIWDFSFMIYLRVFEGLKKGFGDEVSVGGNLLVRVEFFIYLY